MNDKSFTAVLGIIVPEIVHRISENYSCDEVAATEEFYASKVYALLEQEETKLQQVRLQKQRGRKQPERT